MVDVKGGLWLDLLLVMRLVLLLMLQWRMLRWRMLRWRMLQMDGRSVGESVPLAAHVAVIAGAAAGVVDVVVVVRLCVDVGSRLPAPELEGIEWEQIKYWYTTQSRAAAIPLKLRMCIRSRLELFDRIHTRARGGDGLYKSERMSSTQSQQSIQVQTHTPHSRETGHKRTKNKKLQT